MALFKEVVKLISTSFTVDELFQEVEAKTEREVFADKRSASQSEFFNAGQIGLKPQYVFTIRLSEYADETELVYNGKTYSIYRTYEKGENIELHSEVRVGGN
ncbi:phage head closure protein [Ureibacillus composti]|nr:phage head closure protein [Ureibacillus composti]